MAYVYVVTYWDYDERHDIKEPVITVFDNHENALKCYQEFKKHHDGCCFDESIICSVFMGKISD